MNILLVLGHLRAGKTTLIQDLSGALATSGHFNDNEVALVQNDAAFSDGAANLDSIVTHIGMAAGCFGCQDSSKLVAKLHELKDKGFKLCILEPFGFVSGQEMLTILLNVGIPFKIICLVNGEFTNLPDIRHEVVTSQLGVADMAVVTHHSLSPQVARLIELTGLSNLQTFRRGDPDDLQSLLTIITSDDYATTSAAIPSELVYQHEHPMTEVIFLPESFTQVELEWRLTTLTIPGLQRIKGSLGGKNFQASPSSPGVLTYEEQCNPQRNVLVIYGSEGYTLSGEIACLKGAVTRSLLRETGMRTPDELNEELQRLLDAIDLDWYEDSASPQDPSGRFIVYTDRVELVNELRKNQVVHEELAKRAITQRVTIALKAIFQALTTPALFPGDDPICEKLVHYAVTATWFHAEYSWLPKLDRDQSAALADCLVKGIPHLRLGSDAAITEITVSELAVTVNFLVDQLGDSYRKDQLIRIHKEWLIRETYS